MERRDVQSTREILENMTQPELASVKKNWKKIFRISGLLTLGTIAYVSTEALNGEFNVAQTSDAIVTVFGELSALFTVNASSMLSSVKKYIVPPISTH